MITQNQRYYYHIFSITLISITLTSVSARFFPDPSSMPAWNSSNAPPGAWDGYKNFTGCSRGKTYDGLSKLKNYFNHFGYIPNAPPSNFTDDFDEALESAVRTYQKNFNLNVTGELDDATMNYIVKPRCGVADIINGTTSMNSGKFNSSSTNFHTVAHYSFISHSQSIAIAIAMADSVVDVHSILSSPDRDFLLRNTGDQVKIDNLKGKKLGFYFSASWCGPCRGFTPTLVEVYDELSPKGDFEVVFVSADEDDEAFKSYFSKMPWLAIPFSDSETRNRLDELFHVNGIPHLALLDEAGKVITEDGVDIIRDYGAEGYPFTSERVQELKDQEEEAKRNQSLRSILASRSRDFLISSDGNKIPISELEGKTVGLHFCATSYRACTLFTQKLKEVYKKLKENGENFEVVFIPLDDEEDAFKKELESAPWLSLPLKDKTCAKLIQYFELSELPTLVIIGPDGKTLHPNAAEAIEDHGVDAYPFTPEKFSELDEIAKAKEASQTLESVLVSGDQDFVIDKDGKKIPVSELEGKTVLLYFSAHWCPPCRAFLPKLIEAYHKIKAQNNDALEVVFISSDRDQESFNEFFAGMPWLALPFGDTRKEFLSRKFKVSGIPKLVAIGPSGQTVTKEARGLVGLYGADAYPFTEERIKEIEAQKDDIAKGWPEKVMHETHKHELVLSRRNVYYCDGCEEEGNNWSYFCEECDFDLHPNCALGDKGSRNGAKEEEKPKDGWVCDGDVCTKA